MLREMLKMLKLSKVTATATIQKDLGTQGWNPGRFEYSRSIAKFDEADEVRTALFIRAFENAQTDDLLSRQTAQARSISSDCPLAVGLNGGLQGQIRQHLK